MKRLLPLTLLTLTLTISAYAAQGIVDVKSSFGVKETTERLENVLRHKGMTLFNRIEHSEAAKKVGVTLRETALIIFGNPKVGSPLMKCQQSIAIDLPQKVLIWNDSEGKTWISYNDPMYLKKRHHVSGCDALFSKIEKALAGITKAAASD